MPQPVGVDKELERAYRLIDSLEKEIAAWKLLFDGRAPCEIVNGEPDYVPRTCGKWLIGQIDENILLAKEVADLKVRLSLLKEELSVRTETWLVDPHGPTDFPFCPTYFNGCNCTVENLKHNIERAERAEEQVLRLRVVQAYSHSPCWSRGAKRPALCWGANGRPNIPQCADCAELHRTGWKPT